MIALGLAIKDPATEALSHNLEPVRLIWEAV